MAFPSPVTALPSSTPSFCNWYITPTSLSSNPTVTDGLSSEQAVTSPPVTLKAVGAVLIVRIALPVISVSQVLPSVPTTV